MQINEQYWGQPYTSFENNYWNNRTGATDLTDPDFTDYPPFVLNNMNPDYVDSSGTTFTWTLRAAIAKTGSGWEPEKDYPDYSVAYVGMQSPSLPQTDIVCVGPSPTAAGAEVEFAECFKSDPDEVLPIAFISNRAYRNYASVSTYTTLINEFYNPLYKTSQGRFSNGKYFYAPTTRDESGWPNRNCSYDMGYYRSIGLRSIIPVIYVKYVDAELNESTGLPVDSTYTPKSLHWYETQTAEWRAAHPIACAFLRIKFRNNVDGTYGAPPGGNSNSLMPDLTQNLKVNKNLIPEFTGDTDKCISPATMMSDSNIWAQWPLFGHITGCNMTDSGATGQITITAASSSGMSSGQYTMFIGFHQGTFHSGNPNSTSANQRTCWLTYDGTDYEWLRRAAAAYGFFFTDGDENDYPTLFAAGNDPYRWVNENMCLGIVRDGFTNGDYTRGMANPTAPNWGWADTTQSPYNPSLPPNPQPETGGINPNGLTWTLAGKGTGVWALTATNLDQVWQDIFGKDIKATQFGNNPMEAILSLKWTPFLWDSNDETQIILGSQIVGINHTYPVINSVSKSEKHGSGSIKFNFNKNFYNSRNIQARLFLPFYGYYELPAAQLLSSTLKIDFYYNVPDELGVYIISYDDVIHDYCECSVNMDVPLTGSNAAALSASKRSEALTIATQVGSMAVAAVVGASGVKAVASGIGTIMEAGAEGAWAFGGSTFRAGLANIGPLAQEGLLPGMAKGLTGIGAVGATGIGGISNTIRKAQVERAALKTNLPYHGSALQTTFLHMSMKPYVQIFKNNIMEGLGTEDTGTVKVELGGGSKTDYMLKVGHACDVWKNLNEMPSASLLQTTGIANMDTNGMTLAEVQELNSILQNGFFKAV